MSVLPIPDERRKKKPAPRVDPEEAAKPRVKRRPSNSMRPFGENQKVPRGATALVKTIVNHPDWKPAGMDVKPKDWKPNNHQRVQSHEYMEEKLPAILEGAAALFSITQMAKHAGVTRYTLTQWMERAENEAKEYEFEKTRVPDESEAEPKYTAWVNLFYAVNRVYSATQRQAAIAILAAGNLDHRFWASCMTMLERTAPEIYGKHESVKVQADQTLHIRIVKTNDWGRIAMGQLQGEPSEPAIDAAFVPEP